MKFHHLRLSPIIRDSYTVHGKTCVCRFPCQCQRKQGCLPHALGCLHMCSEHGTINAVPWACVPGMVLGDFHSRLSVFGAQGRVLCNALGALLDVVGSGSGLADCFCNDLGPDRPLPRRSMLGTWRHQNVPCKATAVWYDAMYVKHCLISSDSRPVPPISRPLPCPPKTSDTSLAQSSNFGLAQEASPGSLKSPTACWTQLRGAHQRSQMHGMPSGHKDLS